MSTASTSTSSPPKPTTWLQRRWRDLTVLPKYNRAESVSLYHKALLLHWLIIGITALVIVSVCMGVLVGASQAENALESFSIAGIYLVIYIGAFLLNRAGYYRMSAALMIASVWLGPLISAYAFNDNIPGIFSLHWTSVASIILTSALFPELKAIALVGGLNLVSSIGLYMLMGMAQPVTLFGPISTISALTLYTIIIRIHRIKLEAERRAELVSTNKQLQQQVGEREQLAEGLTAILSTSERLMAAPDLDALWKLGIELAREHLGVERCAIYQYEPTAQTMAGTYGTDIHGQTTDERGKSFAVASSAWVASAFTGPRDKPWDVKFDTALFNSTNGEVVATGWNAFTVISTHAGLPSALLFSDSAISGKPFDPTHQDMVGLYCSMLGGIVERKRAELQRAEQQAALQVANTELQTQMAQREQLTTGLTRILRATDELLVIPDLDQLWKRGTELVRELLGAERTAILEYDPTNNTLNGTYGTTIDGVTIPEHTKRVSLIDDPWLAKVTTMRGGKAWEVQEDRVQHEFSDGKLVPISRGWLACTPISSRHGTPAAILLNDDARSGRPFDPIRQDLIGVYCSLLGGIIERKRAEFERDQQQLAVVAANDQLTQQMEARERLTSGLTTILDATQELLAAPNLDALWRRGVELTRERLGVDRCSVFEFHSATNEISGTYGTNMSRETIYEFNNRFCIDDMPWASYIRSNSRDRAWFVSHDIVQRDYVDGTNRAVGKGWSAVTPVASQDGLVTAIYINDNATTGQPFDPIKQDLIGVYCSLLGSIAERKRAEAELDEQQLALVTTNDKLQQQMQEHARLTTGLTNILNRMDELLVTPSLDQLWKRGVELAREMMELDRNSIFVYDATAQEMIGTYGTNMAGKTVDERAKRFNIRKKPWLIDAMSKKSNKPWDVQHDQELWEFRNEVDTMVAHGWLAYTVISNRAGVPSAIMFYDNSISHRPFDPLTQNLVGLYCSLLGGIIERKRAEAQLDQQQVVLRSTNELLNQQNIERERLTVGLTTILNVADELLAMPDMDRLLKRSVELARERLCLDRCSIFEYDKTTNELTGTYGTDMTGATFSEHINRFSLAETPWDSFIRSDKRDRPWLVSHDVNLRAYIDGTNRVIGKGWVAVTPICGRDGLPNAVFLSDNAIKNQPFDPIQQDLVGLYCSLLNGIIERKRAEAQLEENIKELKVAKRMADESSRIKSEFLATVSHELRTPLNAIIGFSDMLLMGMSGELNPKQQHKMTRLRENGVRLLTLINNVLDLTRLEARRVEIINRPFSPRELVKRIAAQTEVLAQQKHLDFNIQIDPALPSTLNGDEQRIEQVVVNLLSNAFKFTEKGSVTLSVNPDPVNNAWALKVIDTGIGIPPHALNMIFEEFRQVDGSFSRTYKGSGLGLAITRNLIRLMNGHINVSSEIGKGSVFAVSLPIVNKSTDQAATQQQPDKAYVTTEAK